MIETIPEINDHEKSRSKTLTKNSEQNQLDYKNFWKTNKTAPSFGQYNLTISKDDKFIWFRNAKVGTRLIFSALENENISLIAESPSNCYYCPSSYEDYFKFAFVRNPWERFVSGWLDKVVKNNLLNFNKEIHEKMQDFESFVIYCSELNLKTCNRHFRHQNKLIDLNEIDYLGRMESFNNDLKQIFDILGLSLKKVPIKNKSETKSSYDSFYTNKTKEMISDMYRKDIQLFKYSYDLNKRH